MSRLRTIRPWPHGINSEGLKRRGFSGESIMTIKRAYKTLYKSGLSLDEAKAAIAVPGGQSMPELQLAGCDFLDHTRAAASSAKYDSFMSKNIASVSSRAKHRATCSAAI